MSLKSLFRAFALLALWPLASGALAAPPDSSPAGPITGGLEIDGKLIPLPEGEWRATGQARADGVASLALLRVQGESVVGAVLIQTAEAKAGTAWGKAPGCERAELPLARVRYASDHDGSCAWVAHIRGAGKDPVDPAWLAAIAEAGRNRWKLPAGWVMAGVRVTDPRDAVQVRYAFPASPGQMAAPSASWVDGAWDRVELGLRHRIDPSTPLPGWPPATAGAGGPGAGEDADGRDGGLTRALWKTVTWRAMFTTIDFTSTYVVVGSVASAVTLSAFGFVIGPFLYLGHEMAWDYFGSATPPARDLPGMGEETPS